MTAIPPSFTFSIPPNGAVATTAGIPVTGLVTSSGCLPDTHVFMATGDSCLCGTVKVLPATTAAARIDDMSWPTR